MGNSLASGKLKEDASAEFSALDKNGDKKLTALEILPELVQLANEGPGRLPVITEVHAKKFLSVWDSVAAATMTLLIRAAMVGLPVWAAMVELLMPKVQCCKLVYLLQHSHSIFSFNQ